MAMNSDISAGQVFMRNGDWRSAYAALCKVADDSKRSKRERSDALIAMGECVMQDPSLGGDWDDCGFPLYLLARALCPDWSMPHFYILMTYDRMGGWHRNEWEARNAANGLRLLQAKGLLEPHVQVSFEKELERLRWQADFPPIAT